MYYEQYRRRLRRDGESLSPILDTRRSLRTKVRQQRSFSNRSFDAGSSHIRFDGSYSPSCNSSMSSESASTPASSPAKSSPPLAPSPPQPQLRSNVEPNEKKQKQRKLLVLISNGVIDRTQSSNQSKALAVLNARGTPYSTLDGMDPSNRDRRDELFGMSGIRGNYPQFFLISMTGGEGGGCEEGERTEYWGGYDRLEAANESSSIPADVLEAHPEIETWEGAFGNVAAEFR